MTATSLQGIALLYGMFVEPAHWKRGVGRVLFGAAATRAKALKAGVLMIYAEPSAEGFYKRMGATRVGEGTFYYSPEIVLPQLLYILLGTSHRTRSGEPRPAWLHYGRLRRVVAQNTNLLRRINASAAEG